MALDESPLRTRVRRAVIGCLLLLDDSEIPRELRPAFGRLTGLVAPVHHERGLTIDLQPLSDEDVRHAAWLIVELNGCLNPTWRSSADRESAQALDDRRRANLVS